MGNRYQIGNAQKRILLALYQYQSWIDGISIAWTRRLLGKRYVVTRAFITRNGKRYEYKITKRGIRYVENHLLERQETAA